MDKASRSQSALPVSIGMTPKKPSRWSMGFPLCKAHEADRGAGQSACSVTAAMMRRPFGKDFERVAFCR